MPEVRWKGLLLTVGALGVQSARPITSEPAGAAVLTEQPSPPALLPLSRRATLPSPVSFERPPSLLDI